MLCWRKGCWRRQEEPYLIVIRSGWKPCIAFSFWRVQLVWLVWKKHVKVNGRLCPSPCWSLARSIMQKAIQSPVDSGIPLIKPDYTPSWSTFAQWWPDTTMGCFTGWVHSSSPHKTLFEPICFYISLLPSPLLFKISFSIFMGVEESLCPGQRHLCCSPGTCCVTPTSEQSIPTLPTQQGPTPLELLALAFCWRCCVPPEFALTSLLS